MKLLFLLAGVSGLTFDFTVTCPDAPAAFTIDGVDNRALSVVAGDVLNFNFAPNCVGLPMAVRRLDGSILSSVAGSPTAFTIATSLLTPQCLVYFCTAYPTTMMGAISVAGGAPCVGASALFPAALPTIIATATTPLVTATATTPLLTASATLYPITAAGAIVLPSGCTQKICPALLPCLGGAITTLDYDANGCPGCQHCVTPILPCCPVGILPSTICRDCGVLYI